MAARSEAVGLDSAIGRDPARLREVLREVAHDAVVIHAAGNVADPGPPSAASHVESTRGLFEAVAEVCPRATIGRESERRGVGWRHLRLHNLIGPGTPDTLAPAALATRLRQAIAAGDTRLEISDGDAVRDWLDVRDAVRIVLALADRGAGRDGDEPIEVCSGVGRSVRTIAEALVAAAGTSIAVVETPGGAGSDRSSAVRSVVGDPRRLRDLIGKEANPRLSFEQAISDLWRARGIEDSESVS
ncbi:MAG: NAD-dependent epimerase/dehydratase family protein [Planctomycetota bacterium]|jgi:nucleoside-diphosphate-sugar epimerase